MRKNRFRWGLGAALSASLAGYAALPAEAVTTVNLGTVSTFNGPGGLDLTGNFPYAINFSNNDPNITVGGVTFLHDRQVIPGATLVGPNEVTPWANSPNFGATSDDNNLEQIMQDIRWANSGANQFLQADLAVQPGVTYKVQSIFYGNQQEARHWDILFEGALAVDRVTSLGLEGSVYANNAGVVWTHTFVATDSTMSLVFDGRPVGSNGGADSNPIWQALTLEALVPEPATFGLIGLGALGLLRRRSRDAT